MQRYAGNVQRERFSYLYFIILSRANRESKQILAAGYINVERKLLLLTYQKICFFLNIYPTFHIVSESIKRVHA